MTGFVIDDELASFLIEGNSILVATRSAALEPNATRACGLRVVGPDSICVALPRATSAQAIANLRDNGDIALCVGSPRNYRAVQLKGRSIAVGDAGEQDLLQSQRQLVAFSSACAAIGVTRQQARNLWLFDNWCVEVRVVSAFTQTPGPGAGARMLASHGR